MIIAVNIRNSRQNHTVINAASGDWSLNLTNATQCQFVIAVERNQVQGYFAVEDVIMVNGLVRFRLREATEAERRRIMRAIAEINLAGFTVKYIALN